MSKTILVGCKLPNGFIAELPNGAQIHLNGTNTAFLSGAPGLTHVDEVAWMKVSTFYAKHSAFESGAIFSHSTSDKVADIAAKAEDLKSEKTGMEPVDPLNPGSGIKPEEGQAKKELEAAVSTPKAPKKATKGKDQAAAVELANAQV